MERLKDLAGKIRRLYKANQAEWLQLANQGLEQVVRTKGPFCFIQERPLDLPGVVVRLSGLHDAILRSSPRILDFPDLMDNLDANRTDLMKSAIYPVVLYAVKNLTQEDIVQVEAWYDDVAEHFDNNVRVKDKDIVPSTTEKQKKVLRYLAEQPTLIQYQADIESGTDISRHTISKILGELHEMGLVNKEKKGVCITRKGLDYPK